MARLNSSVSAWPWVSLVVARLAARCASVAFGTVRNESSLDTALLPPQPAATAAIARRQRGCARARPGGGGAGLAAACRLRDRRRRGRRAARARPALLLGRRCAGRAAARLASARRRSPPLRGAHSRSPGGAGAALRALPSAPGRGGEGRAA